MRLRRCDRGAAFDELLPVHGLMLRRARARRRNRKAVEASPVSLPVSSRALLMHHVDAGNEIVGNDAFEHQDSERVGGRTPVAADKTALP